MKFLNAISRHYCPVKVKYDSVKYRTGRVKRQFLDFSIPAENEYPAKTKMAYKVVKKDKADKMLRIKKDEDKTDYENCNT